MHYAVRVFTYTYKTLSQAKRWARISFVSPQIANPQILGLIPQSQICKFMRCAAPQIANTLIENLRKNILDYEMPCNCPPLRPSNKSSICYHEYLDVHEYEKQRKFRTSETPEPMRAFGRRKTINLRISLHCPLK
jgi:hypothetical protein